MRVVCDNCSVSYEFDASQIPQGGYEAKCKSCNHVFFVVPEPEVAHVTVSCGHCGAVYQFSASQIPEGGYDAQCTQCQKVFFVSNNGAPVSPNSAAIIPKAPPVIQSEIRPASLPEASPGTAAADSSDRPLTMELDPIEVDQELQAQAQAAPLPLDASVAVTAAMPPVMPQVAPASDPEPLPTFGGPSAEQAKLSQDLSDDDEISLKPKRPVALLGVGALVIVGAVVFAAYTFMKPAPVAPPPPPTPAAVPVAEPAKPVPQEVAPAVVQPAAPAPAEAAPPPPAPMQKLKKGQKAKHPGKAKGKQKRARP